MQATIAELSCYLSILIDRVDIRENLPLFLIPATKRLWNFEPILPLWLLKVYLIVFI